MNLANPTENVVIGTISVNLTFHAPHYLRTKWFLAKETAKSICEEVPNVIDAVASIRVEGKMQHFEVTYRAVGEINESYLATALMSADATTKKAAPPDGYTSPKTALRQAARKRSKKADASCQIGGTYSVTYFGQMYPEVETVQ